MSAGVSDWGDQGCSAALWSLPSGRFMPGPATSLPLAQQQYFSISVAVMVLFFLFLCVVPPFSSPAAWLHCTGAALPQAWPQDQVLPASSAAGEPCCRAVVFLQLALVCSTAVGRGSAGEMGCSDPCIAGWFSLSPWSWSTSHRKVLGSCVC